MPYDSNGNYVLPAIYQAKAGTVIMTEQHNTPFEDVQAALNKAFLRDGSAPLLANMKMAGFRITGLGNGTSANDAVTVSQLNSLLSNTALTGSTTVEGLLAIGNKQSGSLYYSGSIGAIITGYLINNSGVPATQGQTYRTDLWMEVNPGVSTYALLRAWTWQGERRWQFTETGDIVSDIRGSVAWKSDLANYQPAGSYAYSSDLTSLAQTVAKKIDGTPTSGNLPVLNLQLVNAPSKDNPAAYVQLATSWGALILPTSGRVSQMLVDYAQPKGSYQAAGDYALESDLPLDKSKKLQCFRTVIQSGQRVNYPSGFSSRADSINITASQRLDLWWTNDDAGGFTINSNSSASQEISVTASGNR